MSSLQQAIASSRGLSEFIHDNLGEEVGGAELKQVIAIALLTIYLEHREATLALVGLGAYTSSRGVARAALEAHVTGLWFENVATDALTRALMRAERSPPKFESMAQRLRQSHPLGELFEKLRGHYKTLSDYMHGHVRQVSRWIGTGGIEPKHSDGEMTEVLRFVDTVGVLACISRESIASRPIEPLTGMFERVLRGQY